MSISSTNAGDFAARRSGYLADALSRPVSPAAAALGAAIEARIPGAAIILYGSGNSVSSAADAASVVFDFYAIALDYGRAFRSPLLRALNRILPPNVFFIETDFEGGKARAKYAVLSISHFEKLVSRRTFHSYFWARFAQPCRIVAADPAMRARIIACVETAIDTFVARSAGLARNDAQAAEIWREGLARSYRAELRAEPPERVARLLAHYGDWPDRVTPSVRGKTAAAALAWRLRSLQGGALSVLRLLKGALTFDGGVEYIAWKIGRHAGFTLPVRAWEKRWPLIAAPVLASRYYRMRREVRRRAAAP